MRVLFFLGLLILSVPIVWAQNAAVEAFSPSLQSRVVDSDPLMDFRTQNVPQGRVDRDTGILRAAYRLVPTVPLGATHEATARAYLDAEAERFGWATADDLLLVREIDGHYSAHLTFQQTFGGIPVHNRFVKVNMGPGGHPSMVLSGYAPHLRDAGPVRLQPLMDASGAVLRAQQETLTQRVSTPELVVYPSASPRLAWQMTASPDGSVAAWEVLMDADTGEIIYLRDQAMHTPSSAPARAAPLASASSPALAEPATVPAARAVVDGTGLVFDPDPLTSAGAQYGGAYVDNDDADVAVLNAQRKEVVLHDITRGSDGLYRLIGPYVEIISRPLSLGVPRITPPAEADPNAFRYGRGNDSFEAVMAYYHIDKNQRYIQSLDVGYPIAEYPVLASPHGGGLRPGGAFYLSENCHFFGNCGSPKSIYFSDQDIDSAEDADVILHGYAWALLDAGIPGLFVTSESFSFGRGWANYWVASYSRGLAEEEAVPTFQDWRTIFNWDRASPMWRGRQWRIDMPVGDRYRYGESPLCDHYFSCSEFWPIRLWATTMMEIYDELGKRVTDRLTLASHAYLGSSSTFVDAAEALLQADEDLYDREHRSILREKLAARGYLSAEEPLLSVTLSVSPARVAEDVGTAPLVTVTATVDGGRTFAKAQTVAVSVGTPGDSAEGGRDYAAVEDFAIIIPADDASATGAFTLNLVDDVTFEGDETVGVTGLLMYGTVTPTVLTITDSDAESDSLRLTISPESVEEDADVVRLEVTASLNAGASKENISVMVSVADGTAESGDDYRVDSNPSPLEIPAGEMSVTGMVELSVLDDEEEEEDETIVIGASATGLRPASQDLVITANDVPLLVTLSVSPSTVTEDVGRAEVTVTATVDEGTLAKAQTVAVSVGMPDDSAVEGTDYAAVDDFEIMIPAGGASATGTFTLNPTNDAILEGDETVGVAGSLSGGTVTPAMVTITDDDVQSKALVLTISPESVGEDAGTNEIEITASLNEAVRSEATAVTISVADGTALLGDDYRVVSFSSPLEIPAGMASIMGMVEIEVLEDDFREEDETIVIGASATDLAPASQDLVITANDASLSVTLSVSPPRVAENVSTAPVVTVTATVDGDRMFVGPQAVMVSVGTSDDSAVEGTDYAAVGDFTITIPAGAASATGSFTLDPINDDLAEGSETVSVAGFLSDRTVTPAQFTITDDDVPSTALVLMISPESVEEDAGTGEIQVTASLNGAAHPAVTAVTIRIADGTASSADYATVRVPSSLVIPSGERSVTGTVQIDVVDDDAVEEDETIIIGVSAEGLTRAREALAITDNDASLSVTLSVSPSTVAEELEAAPVVTVTATVDGGRTFAGVMAVTVSVGTLGDSAEEGTDYVAVGDFAITIPGGSSSATGTFTLAPVDDDLAEGDETVSVEGALDGRTVTPAQVTIMDDDVQSKALVLTVAPARLHENSGTSWVRFTAGLNNAAAPMDIPVDVSVTDGTATAGADYSISVAPSSIVIPAGEMSISDSLQITVTDDDAAEGNETVVIGVSTQGLTGTMQDLVIIDDETAVRIDVLNVIAKDDGNYTITAAVRQNLGAPVTSVVLYYGDGVTFETTPMQTLVMGSSSLYRAELMAPDEGGILYYYVVATNGDGLTARYPPDGRYWDISNYIAGSRLVFLDFEDGDASDQSAAKHHVAYKGGAGALAEGALALDGLEEYAEILGSSLGASEEFALELMFNADDVDAGKLDGNGIYLVAKPARCSTCWGESMFSLLWGGSGNSSTYVAARFWNSEYEGEQVELEVPLLLASGQWYHAVLQVQKEDAGQRAVLQLRDGSGQLYGEDAAVLPASPAISQYPIFVGHIGDRGFFDGRIDNVAFYNYAHFASSLASAEDAREVPEGYVLEQNYPNPFNPVTTIRYDLARVGHVSLEVSDLLGRRVAVLVDEVQQAGAQEVRFDAGDLPSGMYLYRLRVEDFVSVKKMVLLK